MKVICIHKCDQYIGERSFWTSPEVGDEVTVLTKQVYEGAYYYTFSEYPGFAYDVKCFAVLPDQTAGEMQEESKEAIVNLEMAPV